MQLLEINQHQKDTELLQGFASYLEMKMNDAHLVEHCPEMNMESISCMKEISTFEKKVNEFLEQARIEYLVENQKKLQSLQSDTKIAKEKVGAAKKKRKIMKDELETMKKQTKGIKEKAESLLKKVESIQEKLANLMKKNGDTNVDEEKREQLNAENLVKQVEKIQNQCNTLEELDMSKVLSLTRHHSLIQDIKKLADKYQQWGDHFARERTHCLRLKIE